ncbi:HNH endonuclease signature motif containing protein [uncultured Granulicatella sp.]|uniref:HNH endonuclease signature motif containing protein n=1 Tax=uncultured Granulicatella sp. TaxID=316089 RepID=UPI0028D032D0|nr:HNH endonuclease signature motif containing protein [uncultured Granulicatella sp.]
MYEKVLNLRKVAQEGMERAKQFTLEVPTVRVVREASTGSQMMQLEKISKSLGDTGLGKSLDNLASKAKNVENASLSRLRARKAFYSNKVDDVAKGAKEAAEQAGKKARQEFSEETVENVSRDISESRSLFVGKLRGEDITLYDIEMKKINYVKRDRSVLKELRNDFNKFVRKDFLKSISSDIKNLKSHGLSETDIQKLKDGLVPKGYQVHHELPLDDSGTNDFSNLVLIKNEPYHKVVTNYQNSIARTMKIGESKEVLWQIIGKNIYN